MSAEQQHILPIWTWASPMAAWAMVGVAYGLGIEQGPVLALFVAALIATVLASVHHAEVVAHRVGEPLGTLVLSVAVTTVELSLILTLMLEGGAESFSLARDSLFAAFMIATTGIIGASLLIGGLRYGEAAFQARGANAALSVLGSLAMLVMVLPNFTIAAHGPIYSPLQMTFVAVVSLILYLTFVFVQTVRHPALFLPDGGVEGAATRPSAAQTARAAGLLLAGLVAVVLLADSLAPALDDAVERIGAPASAAGVAIAALVMLPEALAAMRAARRNQLQVSLNLALGSALATIGLTIPGVAVASKLLGEPLVLGVDPEHMVLIILALLVSTMTLANGRATILQGAVHLTIFATFLLVSFQP